MINGCSEKRRSVAPPPLGVVHRSEYGRNLARASVVPELSLWGVKPT
jgi:hypothetical protein